MKMLLLGNINLHLAPDRRWYVVEERGDDPDERRIIGRPEGYLTHMEASRWRTLYRQVRTLQGSRGRITPARDEIRT